MTSYIVRGQHQMQGLRLQVSPSPATSLRGWERRAGAANPARMCHCPAQHAPLPIPGRSDCSAVPGVGHPGREEAQTRLTMLAGEEGGSGELAFGFRTRPAHTGQVMVPAGSGSPRPCKDNRFPTRAPQGPSKKSWAPRPASSGTPGTIHPDAPVPPQAN